MLQECRGRRSARQWQGHSRRQPELHKLAASVSEALRERGVTDPGTGILGEVAIAIFRISFER
jgi:hypothetical protein